MINLGQLDTSVETSHAKFPGNLKAQLKDSYFNLESLIKICLLD